MNDWDWDIRRTSRRRWEAEARSRFDMLPEKFEMIDGELLLSDEERINLLGVLLELVGTDRAIQMGDATTWRRSVDDYL